jgi:hypothetical protein
MHLFNSLSAKFPAFIASLSLFVNALLGINQPIHIEQAQPVTPPPVHSTATTTLKTTSKPTLAIATTTKSKTTAPIKATIPTQNTSATKVVKEPATNTTTSYVPQTADLSSISADTATIEDLNTETRAALVNILCTTVTGGSFRPISGSGVIVDSRGIILTNAHVAQYFLLKNYPFANNIDCIIRSKSPAQPLYTAELLYLPQSWVNANASELTATHAQGTGENDYAFLRITGVVSYSVSLPSQFPSVPMSSTAPQEGAPTLLVAYPAGLLDGQTIQTNLYSSSAVSTVKTLYSFDGTQNVDLIAVKGSVVSQTGSSGGALIGLGSKKLLGIIVTETSGTTTSDRELNAVTVAHIDRSLSSAGKGGINSFLLKDAATEAADFNKNIAPGETAQLEAVLKKLSN